MPWSTAELGSNTAHYCAKSGSKWCPQSKTSVLVSGILNLHFCTVGGSGDRSSIFMYSHWFKPPPMSWALGSDWKNEITVTQKLVSSVGWPGSALEIRQEAKIIKRSQLKWFRHLINRCLLGWEDTRSRPRTHLRDCISNVAWEHFRIPTGETGTCCWEKGHLEYPAESAAIAT